MPAARKFRCRLLAVLASGLVACIAGHAPIAGANGWEHTAIDFDVLVEALGDPDAEMRRRAAESLGYRPREGADAALLARLERGETSARVRSAIYRALGAIGAASALPALARCLAGESDIAARASCAGALANIDDPEALVLALDGVGDSDLPVRLHAIASLGNFADARAVEALEAWTKDEDARIRDTALLALGNTRTPAATRILLAALGEADDAGLLLTLLRALALAADPVAADALREFLARSDDENLRRHALVALARAQAEGSEALFLDALASADPASRALGLAILREHGEPAQVPAIVAHAQRDVDGLFGRDGKRQLAPGTETRARLALLSEYLRTVNRLDPAGGGPLFARLAAPRAVDRASTAGLRLAQQLHELRWQALYGLGYARAETADKLLLTALDDRDARIRAVALRSLGVRGEGRHHAAIRAMLGDAAAEVRWQAARVLGRLGANDVTDDLIARLADDHAQVRLETVLALGYLGADAARSRLELLARDDADARVREAARYAASLIR